MANDSICNPAFPSSIPQKNNVEKLAASRRIQNAKDGQQQTIQNKRTAQKEELQAQKRVEEARSEEMKARENVRKALADQQQVARKSIDVIV